MNLSFRPVTEQDLDFVYALPEIEAIKPHLGEKRERCDAVKQSRQIAEYGKTGGFIMNLPQRDRMDGRNRYLLVCAKGIVVMQYPGPPAYTDFPVLYVSPALTGQLDVLAPLLREMFCKGGEYLSGKPLNYELDLYKEACFVVESDRGE